MDKKEYQLKSRHLQSFIKEITFTNRNPKDNKVLNILDDVSTNPERVLLPQDKLYRCRIVSKGSKLGVENNFWGYSAKESFVAPPEFTKDMRANYKYIPYLYCASNPYTALVEVRPRIGSVLSIATIQVKEKITLLDFTLRDLPKKMKEAKMNLFSDLSYLFSKPIAYEDDTLDYIPTQYIAEYAKSLGYDGIVFESSLTPEIHLMESLPFKLDWYNAVIFNYNKCIPIRSNLFEVQTQYTDCQQIDSDKQRLDTDSSIGMALTDIADSLSEV